MNDSNWREDLAEQAEEWESRCRSLADEADDRWAELVQTRLELEEAAAVIALMQVTIDELRNRIADLAGQAAISRSNMRGGN